MSLFFDFISIRFILYFVVAASVVSAAVVGSEPSLTVTFSAIYF